MGVVLDYVSTRGLSDRLGFSDVLSAGLARDGGLYVPSAWPVLTERALTGLAYKDAARVVMTPFIGDAVEPAALDRLLTDAYTTFGHHSVAPLAQIGPDLWLMELFHGPTLAFKDVAMQVLGRLFDLDLARRGRRATILGATSGDTGSAAIEAFRGRPSVDVFILYPEGRVSEVQRRQMTTVADANIHAIAVDGTFDDCQALVKQAFGDLDFRDATHLAGVNSINWARVLPQVVYYVTAAAALGGRPVHFSVPTGNFGDVYAGYVAKTMGVSVGDLIVATNVNDILVRVLETGRYAKGAVVATTSPSMDIQVSSNFERLLFDLVDRDPGVVRDRMADLARSGGFDLEGAALARARRDFSGVRIDEAQTRAAIAEVWNETGLIIDPHTAIGVAAAKIRRAQGLTGPIVALATAHPAKFPDAVAAAMGRRPALPARLSDIYERPERVARLPASLDALKAHIIGERRG